MHTTFKTSGEPRATPRGGFYPSSGRSFRHPTGNPKLKSALKSYWTNMTPEQRKARIAKMQAWRKKK